jgi:hypothetical protein
VLNCIKHESKHYRQISAFLAISRSDKGQYTTTEKKSAKASVNSPPASKRSRINQEWNFKVISTWLIHYQRPEVVCGTWCTTCRSGDRLIASARCHTQ